MTQDTGLRDLAATLATIQELKRVRRTGWVDRGVPPADVESVADHTLLTALIAWLAAIDDPALDATRVLKLAVVHDLAESIVGDAPPYEANEVPDRANQEAFRAFFSTRHLRTPEHSVAKHAAEADAFATLVAGMPPHAGAELVSLWEEYESRSSPEARFVKQVDTLEAYLQARHYAAEDPNLPLWGFSDMAEKEIDHPTLSAIRDAAPAAPDDGL